MKLSKILQFSCISLSLIVAFSCKGPNEPDDPNDDPNNKTEEEFDPSAVKNLREILDEYYADDYFFIGQTVNFGFFNEENMTNALNRRYIKEFSYNTPGNDFKQAFIMPTPTSSLSFGGCMGHIEAAREYDMVIRAHGPISPQCSSWAKEDNRTPEEMETMLKRFLTEYSKELEKNSDVIKWMDVVNETFCQGVQTGGIGYDGTQTNVTYQADDWFGPRKGTNQWENPWPLIGFETLTYEGESFQVPKYIRMAFETAQQYAPSVKKIYNEHGMCAWDKIQKTILALRADGVQIDGIGWQAHVGVGWENEPGNVEMLQDLITWCYENGLEFHITELDVAVTAWGADTSINMAALEATRNEQAATISTILNLMLKNMNKGACGINFWCTTDCYSDGKTIAALFQRDGTPNEIFYRIKRTLVDFKTKEQ